MGIKEAVTKFSERVEDLSTLEVLTYTGKLEHAVDPKTGQLDWSAFKPTSGVLTLAAATRISADYDTVNFRASDVAAAGSGEVLALHKAAVESAQSGRVALLSLFRGLVDGAG